MLGFGKIPDCKLGDFKGKICRLLNLNKFAFLTLLTNLFYYLEYD